MHDHRSQMFLDLVSPPSPDAEMIDLLLAHEPGKSQVVFEGFVTAFRNSFLRSSFLASPLASRASTSARAGDA